MRRLAVANRKGATGKTTTAVPLAAGLAGMDDRVLLVDTNAQGNCTKMLGRTWITGLKTLWMAKSGIRSCCPTD